MEKRINLLKELFDNRVTYDLFWNLLYNMHNGPTRRIRIQWNSFDIAGWAEFYKRENIEVNENQIKLVFDYLNIYHNNVVIGLGQNKYQANHNYDIQEENFMIELIALKVQER
ncbi:hypothetical protein M0G43_08480 [Subsaxibacter sp. CAU 1640]|uniref:hypothetical protein n=1 Tax=Subsaxibacter sp. CAU 1640 TaxID=2933271 RepID=UPI002006D557|nr:hypothetical protein [Subsaxibacter sp. CAU 1640]MCK7590606.1 hypothetical protein [Subsaxibacter sp. CAU 1640]